MLFKRQWFAASAEVSLAGVMWKATFVGILTLVCLTSGCTDKKPPLGQLMVTVLTDAPLPDYVDGIRLQAFQEADNAKPVLIFDREPEVAVGAGKLLIPTTLAIVSNGRATDRVRLRLLAQKFGQPRVLREAVTQVPLDRIAELRLPIEWLCDGSALPGDPTFCSDPEYTCSGGRCIPKWIDPSTLPNYGGPLSQNPASGLCFDVPMCFGQSYAVPLQAADCSIPAAQEGLASFNVALVVKPETGGQCLPGGNCLVSVARGPLGWDVTSDGTRIALPLAVCTTKANLIKGIVVSQSCATKQPGGAICGAWSPFTPGANGGDGGASSDAGAAVMCERNSQCSTGFCVQGRCCDSACVGACRSCAVPGQVGICTNLIAGTLDPTGSCLPAAADTCGLDGFCDGVGGCRQWAAGTRCAISSCSAGNMLQTSACNGSGACESLTQDCGAYRCGADACVVECQTKDQCAAGFYCNNGACTAQRDVAQACGGVLECKLGFCFDGVCCSSVCNSVCESCALAGAVGQCKPLSLGENPANECGAGLACSGASACAKSPIAFVTFFDTNAGSTVASKLGGAGTGTIRSGTALDSPAVNGIYTPGVQDGALSFSGTRFVTFPNSPALDALNGSTQLTAAAWVRVPPLSQSTYLNWIIVRMWTLAGSDVDAFSLGLLQGVPYGRMRLALSCATGAQLPANTWAHVALTFEAPYLRVYVNGNQGCQVDTGDAALIQADTPLFIGAAAASGSMKDFFLGDIDDVFLSDRALSSAELKVLMNNH